MFQSFAFHATSNASPTIGTAPTTASSTTFSSIRSCTMRGIPSCMPVTTIAIE